MTEEEWLTSDDVAALLTHAEHSSSSRKRRLFILDCAQRVCHLSEMGNNRHPIFELLTEAFVALESGTALLVVACFNRARRQAAQDALRLDRLLAVTGGTSRHAVRQVALIAVASNLAHAALSGESWWQAVWDIDDELSLRHNELENYRDEVCRENIPALRCIVGNPFRPVAFDPRWRTEHAIGIARKMYDDREFAAMPILADALEEAGCDSEAVLNHCREPGPHARGCWVVDGILGKR